ncbi:uncharacterized protein LOC142979356 [Anticarsia gemmatalis]|uniref:uncharacterized protein LOC142979356 n=1 Tax=Anticarsia gemmatalis TaxID=129554 RepID=UPI003F761526
MFESDDFDQVLSQFEFPEDVTHLEPTTNKSETDGPSLKNKVLAEVPDNVKSIDANVSKDVRNSKECHNELRKQTEIPSKPITNDNKTIKNIVSPKHLKRKMINSYFDHNSKRKFPGPAGLLTGGFEANKDETVCQMELLSQDVDFTQNNLRGDLFDTPLWLRLQEDLRDLNLKTVDSIKTIKQQAITGSLRRRKAHTITAFVETVDRSVTDPLIIMRDTTGNIKGTLHRDAWSAFSQYIASECCAFILWKPTILTTGATFKKHYLNITLSNILAVYSSTVLNDENENKTLPDGYSVVYEDDYTVIKTQNDFRNIGTNNTINNVFDDEPNDLLDGLDSIFSDDLF